MNVESRTAGLTAEREVRFLQRPEGRIAYDLQGEGPLVVCAPGMGDLREVYRSLVPGLVRAGHRVATMDLRGHGDSDATFSTYDDVATGGDMLALADALGEPAVLVGNSMSAGSAVWAAAESPDSVTRLVLIGPFVRDARMGAGTKLALRLALLRPWGRAAWLSHYARQYRGRTPDDLEDHLERIGNSLRRAGHWAAFIQTTHTSHAPAEARLPEVRAPSLVVMGERDRDFRDPAGEASIVAERLGGHVVMVPDAGHYPQAEFPEVVTPAVVRFLFDLEELPRAA